MSSEGFIEVLVYLLTALALVAIVLTRVRLAGDSGGGRVRVSDALLRAHSVVGSCALVIWLVFLVGGDFLGETASGIIGILALAFWWSFAVIALGLLARWLPSRGRHAVQEQDDRWNSGPALSFLAHLGTLVGVAVFTYAYVNSFV